MTDNGSPPPRLPRAVRCPACGGPSLYAPENPFRPFCSQRCKLYDLGAWASERFRFEVEPDQGIDDLPPNGQARLQ